MSSLNLPPTEDTCIKQGNIQKNIITNLLYATSKSNTNELKKKHAIRFKTNILLLFFGKATSMEWKKKVKSQWTEAHI